MRAMEPVTGPVESKVKAGTLGAAVAGLVVWVLSTYVYSGDVPQPVQALVDIVVPGGVAFLAGWWARHTPRADPDATAPPKV